MTYTIENGIVYVNDGKGTCCIGNEAQYSTTTTDTTIIYQWQKFNITTGVYEDDITNTTAINGVAPTNGKVTVAVTPTVAAPTFEDKVNYLYYKATEAIS